MHILQIFRLKCKEKRQKNIKFSWLKTCLGPGGPSEFFNSVLALERWLPIETEIPLHTCPLFTLYISLSIHSHFCFVLSWSKGSTCVKVAYHCCPEPRHPSNPQSAESGGCLTFNMRCLSTLCIRSNPNQVATTRLMSTSSEGNVPNTPVFTLLWLCFSSQSRRMSDEGKCDYISAPLCIKNTLDICTKGVSICFCWRYWFLDHSLIVMILFELLNNVRIFFFVIDHVSEVPCSRFSEKNACI